MEHDAQSSRRYKENWDDEVQAGKADRAEIAELKEAYALLFKAHGIERARWQDQTSVDCASCEHIAPVTVGVCVGCRREDVTVHVNYKRRAVVKPNVRAKPDTTAPREQP